LFSESLPRAVLENGWTTSNSLLSSSSKQVKINFKSSGQIKKDLERTRSSDANQKMNTLEHAFAEVAYI